MTHITCRLTAKNRDQLRNPTLDNRVYGLPLPFTCICRQRCILRKPTDGDRLNDVRLDYSCNTRTGRISESNRPAKSETGNGNNDIVFSESIRGSRDSVQHRGVFAGRLRLHRSTTYSSAWLNDPISATPPPPSRPTPSSSYPAASSPGIVVHSI